MMGGLCFLLNGNMIGGAGLGLAICHRRNDQGKN
ncbi:MAG: hypothetical protein ACI9MJ_002800 [Alphaproteobacteria bacterium]|jgi:hypothetical protein